MVNLILVILSISLTAATLFASLSYLPSWNTAAKDTYNSTRHGLVTLEHAFLTATAQAGGLPPEPSDVDVDGGMAANFLIHYGYTPKAPNGYAWKYGFNGTDYYFCLYPTAGNSGASEGLWKGLHRVRQVLSDQQYFLVPGSVDACDTATPQSANISTAPASFPALVSAVYLVHAPASVEEPTPAE